MRSTARRCLLLLALSPFAPCVAACTSDATRPSADDAGGARDAAPPITCSGDAESYAAGIAQTTPSGWLTVQLLDATPSPTAVAREATWSILVTDAGGVAQDGILIAPSATMPDAPAVTPVVPQVTPGTAGHYTLSGIGLPTPGLWTVSLTLTSTKWETESVVFSFCVQP